jgi:hypothetical protein
MYMVGRVVRFDPRYLHGSGLRRSFYDLDIVIARHSYSTVSHRMIIYLYSLAGLATISLVHVVVR